MSESVQFQLATVMNDPTSEPPKTHWRFSHVSAYTENVCETMTDDTGRIHYRWLYSDGKIEYICACHRFLNQ